MGYSIVMQSPVPAPEEVSHDAAPAGSVEPRDVEPRDVEPRDVEPHNVDSRDTVTNEPVSGGECVTEVAASSAAVDPRVDRFVMVALVLAIAGAIGGALIELIFS